MTGTVKNVSLDFLTNEVIVTLRVNGKSSAAALSDLIGVDADIEIKKHREKRSLDANAYLWVLIGKIADKLTIPKDEAYLNALKRYGQGGVVKVKDKDVDDLRRMFKYIEPLDELKEENAQYFRFWAVHLRTTPTKCQSCLTALSRTQSNLALKPQLRESWR